MVEASIRFVLEGCIAGCRGTIKDHEAYVETKRDVGIYKGTGAYMGECTLSGVNDTFRQGTYLGTWRNMQDDTHNYQISQKWPDTT